MAEPAPETIRRAQAGDRRAIADLVVSQQRYVYSIAMTIVRDPDDAADLTQDAFIRLLRALGSYRGETKFTTWLYRLVVNLGIDRLRRRGAPPMRLDEDPSLDVASDDPSDDAPLVVERGEEARLVRDALARLPDAQRLAGPPQKSAGGRRRRGLTRGRQKWHPPTGMGAATPETQGGHRWTDQNCPRRLYGSWVSCS